ncbi:MAG: NUDIX hydrolase [Pseudomonadota bacterium]|nr:NUDIX hydrolase [Pseudomonadota bacterium]
MTDRHAHMKALRETGFWGRAAAGCLILARETGRILIPHRSEHCQQPNTWGTWGGAIDSGESPEQAVLRELAEEAGLAAPEEIIPLFVFEHTSGFRYYNFLVTVAAEFEPNINWETQGFEWFVFGDWPEPAHFGLIALLSDTASHTILQNYAQKAR